MTRVHTYRFSKKTSDVAGRNTWRRRWYTCWTPARVEACGWWRRSSRRMRSASPSTKKEGKKKRKERKRGCCPRAMILPRFTANILRRIAQLTVIVSRCVSRHLPSFRRQRCRRRPNASEIYFYPHTHKQFHTKNISRRYLKCVFYRR